MDAYTGRQCKFPPPCNEGYEQFKLQGGGPPCCRKMNHDKGCPFGKFKCPITGHCVMKRYLKNCTNLADFKKEIMGLVDTYGVEVKGLKTLPSYIKTLRGVGGKNRMDRLNRVKHVLNVCKTANVPLVRFDGRFKKWKTLIGECKARFRVPKGGPGNVPSSTVDAVSAAAGVEHSPESRGYTRLDEGPSSLREPLLGRSESQTGRYVPPPLVSFGKRLRLGPSPCAKLDRAACGGNPNCHYTKRGCASKKGTRQTGRRKVVYQGPMGPPSAFGRSYSGFGNYFCGFGKKKYKYTGSSPCAKLDQAACGGNPNCHYTKRGCVSKRGTRSRGVVHEGPMGPPSAFGGRPSSALLKKCKKYGIKTTVKRGKHRYYKKTSVLKRMLAKKMKKHQRKVPKLSKSVLKKCRKYRVKATVKRGKHRVHKSLSLIKRQLRAKGCRV